MLPETTIPLARAESWTGATPDAETLTALFISSLRTIKPETIYAYKKAVDHFLFWAEKQDISVSGINDLVVQQFESHACKCSGFRHYKSRRQIIQSNVRRFVRFLENQSFVEIPDGLTRLDGHLLSYAAFVKQEQYRPGSVRYYISGAEHFAAWVQLSRLNWITLTNDHIEQYANHHCRCPINRRRGVAIGPSGPARRGRGAKRFLDYLRDSEVLPCLKGPKDLPDDLSAYKTWLRATSGATEATVIRYSDELKRMLNMLGKPPFLAATSIRRAVHHRIEQVPGSASLVVTAARSYVRFLVSQGECEPALQNALLPAKRFQFSALPRYIDEQTVEDILLSCGVETAVEIRDKAIMLLLARLGLRAGDICNLQLQDIDWNRGCITVMGKSRRPERLPLPQDAGDAILDYIKQARPRINQDRLFVRSQAPYRPFRKSGEISGIVARSLKRGGFSGLPTASSTFRHSLATRILRSGASLETVGTVLRHRSPATTAIYAKVDINMLLKVAQDWPEGPSC